MKILALDIGAGTEDVLLFDDEKKNIENCVKMVLPSPSQVFASKAKAATRLSKDLFIKGDTIGGGAFAHALKRHVESGFRVFMTKDAAFTVRNSLDEVVNLGIEVVGNEPEGFKGETIAIEEVNIEKLNDFLAFFGETLSNIDVVAVAVQDHGVSPTGQSDRGFRIEKMKQLLERNPKPETFAFMEDEIPRYFLRMRSAARASKRQLPNAKVMLMDTSPDAILGCLLDPIAEKAGFVLAVNLGNSHTMVAVISSGEITALMEHHTRLLNAQKIEKLLIDFSEGTISNEEIFLDNGHGLFFLTDPPSFSKIEKVIATGPNRSLLAETDLPVHFATPAGDVMMAGPVGLVEATKRKFHKN